MKSTIKCFNCGKEILVIKQEKDGAKLLNSFLDGDELVVMCPNCDAVMGTTEQDNDDDDDFPI